MIEEGTFKDLLEDRYRQHRTKADALRDQGEQAKAARHYRKCAEVMSEIADRESSETLAAQRRELAENLSNAADKLEQADSDSDPERRATDRSTSGDEDPSSKPSNGSDDRGDDSSGAAQYLSDPPDTDFGDVGGMSDLKQTLHDKVIDPLERSDLYEEYGVSVVNGILFHGPPGTGKTYVSEALAGELGYSFVDVTPADLTSSLVGEASSNVADLFEAARENQPCLVFIDEIDAIAAQRSGGAQKTQSERQMVNQLLEELSAIQGEDIIVVGATNLLEEVDDAIRRSGRFDERIEVPPPDRTARKAILRIHLRDKPVLTEDIDWDLVADRTEGFVASDMELIATEAAFEAISEIGDDEEIQPIEQKHIDRAIQSVDATSL
jgi:transitional endoplasmic reticulum ATPase